MEIGESLVGAGAAAAHVNTLLGARDGAVGHAFAVSLATPSAGHAPFLAVVRPGVPAKPQTLFVNRASISGDVHARLTWGAAQAGVATGVADALVAHTIAEAEADDLVVIVSVWVDPDAALEDADAIYANNRTATAAALLAGHERRPHVSTVLANAGLPHNPFFTPSA